MCGDLRPVSRDQVRREADAAKFSVRRWRNILVDVRDAEIAAEGDRVLGGSAQVS